MHRANAMSVSKLRWHTRRLRRIRDFVAAEGDDLAVRLSRCRCIYLHRAWYARSSILHFGRGRHDKRVADCAGGR